MMNILEDLEYEIEHFDESSFPLAYLITFRTFGTWLHGDARTSVSRDGRNRYGTQRIKPRPQLEAAMKRNRTHQAIFLNLRMRKAVLQAVRGFCKRRGYKLLAVNVRSNHVHIVIAAQAQPERVADSIKAVSTKIVREKGLIKANAKVWSRGRSRRYLWKPQHVTSAVEYVLYNQGDAEFERSE
ncbi:MAG: transposase [Pyrinomonadaceae bacterium]